MRGPTIYSVAVSTLMLEHGADLRLYQQMLGRDDLVAEDDGPRKKTL